MIRKWRKLHKKRRPSANLVKSFINTASEYFKNQNQNDFNMLFLNFLTLIS